MIDYPQMYKIKNVTIESSITKSFYLKKATPPFPDRIPKPGNFIMLWVPKPVSGEIDFKIPDAIPMSISDYDYKSRVLTITVKEQGKTTGELLKYKEGMYVGVIGPKGNNFSIRGKNILIMSGGIGITPLRFLMKYIKKNNKSSKIFAIVGARSKSDLIFLKEIDFFCKKKYITTDDGTYGIKGYASDILSNVCTKHNIDQIFACGPEIMMKKTLQFSLDHGIAAQFSLERHMHCGIGVCGFCTINSLLVCRDGPIFSSDVLKDLPEFGKKYRLPDGRMKNL